MSVDNFEEVRSGKAKRARAREVEPVAIPLEADIAAVALVDVSVEPITITEEQISMATTAETVTENTAAGATALNDMGDRARGAMERGSKLFGEMNEFTRGNVEALVESGRLAIKGMERMGQEGADYARRSFETLTANARQLAAAKSPTEFVQLQAQQTRAAFDGMVAQVSHSTEAMLKLAGEIAQPISNRVAVVSARVKAAA